MSFPPALPDASLPVHPAGWERAVLERIVLASLREQRAARRWKTAMRLSWLALFVLLAWALFMRAAPDAKKTSAAHTALVELRGEIADEADASARDLLPALRAAFEDKGSRAVVLRINSGGGSPVQAGQINDELLRLKAKHQKKLYVVVDDLCASAAYYIAVAADEIYVDKASLVGSIGVLMDGFGFTGTLEKLGIERRLIVSGRNKGFLDPFSPVNEEQKAHVQTMLDQIHTQFIEVVKKGRGQRLHAAPETFSGLFWTGQQAVEMGLADHLGDTDYVAREVVKAENVVDYTRRDNVAEKLARKFGAAVGEGVVRTLQTLPVLR